MAAAVSPKDRFIFLLRSVLQKIGTPRRPDPNDVHESIQNEIREIAELVHHPTVNTSDVILMGHTLSELSTPCISILLSLLSPTRRIAPTLKADAHRLFQILLEALKPEDINKENRYERTILMEAIRFRAPIDILQALVQHGADVNYKESEYGYTPLMLTSTPEQVVFLMENGAKIDEANTRWGNTALMCAVKEGHIAVVRTLLDYKAKIDLQNNEGETALIVASQLRGNRIPMVQLLLERGAEYNLADKEGYTVWNYAEEQKDGLEDLLFEQKNRNKAKNAVRNHSGFPTNVSKIVGNYLGGRRRRSKTRRGRSKTRRSKTCHRRRRH